jgi:hypothetical protein
VASGEGAKFPSSNFNITIDNEILLCTTRTGDVLTVTRAQEGTAAAIHAAAAAINLNVTAGIVSQIQGAVDAALALGVTGGNSHDHNGGDGAQIDHGSLGGLGDDDHTQYIKHSLAGAENDMLFASGAGAFAKKTLAAAKMILGMSISCGVHDTNNQAIADGVATALYYATEDWDNDSIHDNVINNSRLTCKTAGLYIIVTSVLWEPSVVGRRTICLRLNGITYIGNVNGPTLSDVGIGLRQFCVALYNMAANDYVETIVAQSAGLSLNILGATVPQGLPDVQHLRF